ncbi:hypothetical protein [Bacillus sp. JJ1764]
MYDYKVKNKNSGKKLLLVRDIGENSLLEIEDKGHGIQLTIR